MNKLLYVPPVSEVLGKNFTAQGNVQEFNHCLANVLQSSGDCVMVLDLQGRLLTMNVEGQERLGFHAVDGLRGMYWPDFWNCSSQVAAESAIAEAIAGRSSRFHGELSTAAGVNTWWDVSVRQCPSLDGHEAEVLVMAREITEQKRWEGDLQQQKAQLQLIVDNVPAIMAYVDQQGVCRWANREYLDWYGVELAQVVGRESIEWMNDHVGQNYAEQIRPRLQQALEGHRVSFEAEQVFEGKSRRLSISYTPDVDERGGVRGAVILVVDITQQHETASALKASSRKFSTLTEAVPSIVWSTDKHGQLDYISDRFRLVTGCEPKAAYGAAWEQVIHPEDRIRVCNTWRTAVETGDLFDCRYRVRQQNGTYRWFMARGLPERDETPDIVRWVGVSTDIHDQVDGEAALRKSERGYRLLFRDNPQAMWTYDPATLNFTSVNQAAMKMYGYTEHEFLSMKLTDIRPAEDVPELLSAIAEDACSPRTRRHLRKDGSLIFADVLCQDLHVDRPDRTRLVVASDVTERVHLNKELKRLAEHDSLTGLPNRVLLARKSEEAIARARTDGSRVAFMAIDFDHFKEVNDSFGHQTGDKFLAAAADRLRSGLAASDTLARVGGDEFVAIVEGLSSVDDGVAAADMLVHSLRERIGIIGFEMQSSISLGVAFFPDDALELVDLQRCADQALYAAKSSGKDCSRRFSDGHSAGFREVLAIERGLRTAIHDGRLQVLYQPIVAPDGTIQRLEALLRFDHRDLGELAPDRFIPVAEQSGLILPIGEWVLQETCRQLSRWTQEGKAVVPVAVNVSALQFSRGDLAQGIGTLLSASRVSPDMLQLELTESLLMASARDSLSTLRELKNMGIRVAIDDFGTGYSSLSYLHDFPLDALKIDQSFIQRITGASEGKPIVSAIVQLAKTLRLQIVAEGVETEEQRKELTAMGCDLLQGYLFACPLNASDVGNLLLGTRLPGPIDQSPFALAG